MTVSYTDPDGTGSNYGVEVELWKLNKSTGAQTPVVQGGGTVFDFTSGSWSNTSFVSHDLAPGPTSLDYSTYVYFAQITMWRTSTAQSVYIMSTELNY